MSSAITLRLRAGAALLAALAAGPALADSHRLTAAWEAAVNEEDQSLSPETRARLNVIAYHAAVARLCEGFPVDQARMATVSDEVIRDAVGDLEGDALITRSTDILIDLGTSHGLFLAEGSLHPEEFCAEAEAARADPEFAHLWQ